MKKLITLLAIAAAPVLFAQEKKPTVKAQDAKAQKANLKKSDTNAAVIKERKTRAGNSINKEAQNVEAKEKKSATTQNQKDNKSRLSKNK